MICLKCDTRHTHANFRVQQPHEMLTFRGTKICCWRFGSHRIALTALRLSAVLRVSIRPARGLLARRCDPATLSHQADTVCSKLNTRHEYGGSNPPVHRGPAGRPATPACAGACRGRRTPTAERINSVARYTAETLATASPAGASARTRRRSGTVPAPSCWPDARSADQARSTATQDTDARSPRRQPPPRSRAAAGSGAGACCASADWSCWNFQFTSA